MGRLIDADALKKSLQNFFQGLVIKNHENIDEDVFYYIDNAPTVVNIGTIYRNESCPNKSRCIDYIGYHCEGCNAVEPKRPQNKQRETDVISYIDGLIDGAEAVRSQGKWIVSDKVREGFYICSNCKEISCCKGNFCPDCGADMREEVTNADSSKDN